ncbi:formyl-CoA transferase [Neobacillus bataviensis LMG 21833]|uniref:Formyl-CoA transferase n=1 Tax=Neobacillus bataviensis LMG 21833 TaxID=1117379 RepID=K6D3U6_9BACI|nr:CoA transferase [Neobacillus bataviensis]EKN62723.1 formyl-CoA transferase [Neobacillus bataviensis LMG 21833]
MTKPLDGIKVLDLSWVFSAPFATLMLQDLGAEVVKIERPGAGDRSRSIPPFKGGVSGYFYMLNRGKKSISLNMKSKEGKRLFLNLAKEFDVIVENFVAGTMDKLGIGYEEVKKVNPKIIFASLNGFGSDGPYSHLPCIDGIAQAMGGLMSQNGLEGGKPLKTGPAVADTVSGVYLTVGILSAIIERNKTGKGTRIEVSMMDSVFSVLEESVIRTSMTGESLFARGNKDPLGAPWEAFKTNDDKWVIVCASGNDRFTKVYQGIGREDIVREFEGDDIPSLEKRAANLDYLNQIFEDWANNRTADQVLKFLSDLHIPAGEVKDTRNLIHDPHLKGRNMVVDVQHPVLGDVKLPNLPIKFFDRNIGLKNGDTPIEPQLGEHNKEVLQTVLGLNEDEINRLNEKGVIYDSHNLNTTH